MKISGLINGAGNETRTRDIDLGKVAFYQLNYARRKMLEESGAGNEVRTRDINLGKVTLYQLSYSRLKTVQLYRNIYSFQVFFLPTSFKSIKINHLAQFLLSRRKKTLPVVC